MNRFNIEDYKGCGLAMICESIYEAESFLEYLHHAGRAWISGTSYLAGIHLPINNEEIAYFFNSGTYSADEEYIEQKKAEGAVLYYTDFDWGNEMGEIDPLDAEELSNFLEQFEVKLNGQC